MTSIRYIFYSVLHSVHIRLVWKSFLVQFQLSDLKCLWLTFHVLAATGNSSCQSLNFCRPFLNSSATNLNMATWASANRMEPWVHTWAFLFTNQWDIEPVSSSCPLLPCLWNQNSNIHHIWWTWRVKERWQIWEPVTLLDSPYVMLTMFLFAGLFLSSSSCSGDRAPPSSSNLFPTSLILC